MLAETKEKTDNPEEEIRKKVDEMYENYGVDPDGVEGEGLDRVYRYYAGKKDQLESDLKKSKAFINQPAKDDE